MRRGIMIILALMTLVLGACSSIESNRAIVDSSNEKEWLLTTMNGQSIDGEVTIQFGENLSKVGGNASINRYFGSVEVQGENIDFGILGTTFMAGPDNLMNQERLYLEALSNSKTIYIENNKLTLEGDNTILIFE